MLKFNSGKFRILQISDLQDTKSVSVDTLHFLEKKIPELHPDVIVLTGDQLDSVGLYGKKRQTKEKNIRRAILDLLSVIDSFDIPILVTFGNHDCLMGITNEEQVPYYKELKNVRCFDDVKGRIDDGTFITPIYSTDGNSLAMNIYMVDSNGNNKDSFGGYDCVHQDQMDWLKAEEEKIEVKNGRKVPAILFQHIPVCEIYEILQETDKKDKDSHVGFRRYKKRYFKLNQDQIDRGEIFDESPCMPDFNHGEFDAIKEQGDVFAMYFGHDHYNSFTGTYKGIDLGYCPGAGYNTYGLKRRAMRVFDFDENDIKNYKTFVVFDDNKHLYQPFKNFVYSHAPSSADTAFPFAFRCVLYTTLFVLLMVGLGYLNWLAVIISLASIAFLGLLGHFISFFRNRRERKRLLKKYNRR